MCFYRKWFVAIIAIAICFATAHAQQNPDDKAELTRLEKIWNDAYLHGDAGALNQLLSDDL